MFLLQDSDHLSDVYKTDRTWTWTNSLDETYAHLLEVHFPGCTRISDDTLQQVPKRALLFNCNEVRCVVTEDRIK